MGLRVKSEKLEDWLCIKMGKSNHPVIKWIAKSLKRDRSFPLGWKIKKGIHFFVGMLMAKIYLRKVTKVGKRARTYDGKPFIDNAGTMIWGDDVIINCRNVRSDFVTHPHGLIEFGNFVTINFGASFVAEKHIKIGDGCRFGPYCFIFDSNAHFISGDRFKWAPGETVILEDDVWLSSHVTVLKGSMIGRNATIAAGSVVSGYIPPYTIAGGIPARVIKYLKPPDGVNFPWIKREKDIPVSPAVRRVITKSMQNLLDRNELPSNREPLSNINGWDSIKQLYFLEVIESELGIRFTNEDVVKMTSINKINQIVAMKVKGRNVMTSPQSLKEH